MAVSQTNAGKRRIIHDIRRNMTMCEEEFAQGISTGIGREGSGQMGVFDIETKLVKFPRATNRDWSNCLRKVEKMFQQADITFL